jgi:hypothetical protein
VNQQLPFTRPQPTTEWRLPDPGPNGHPTPPPRDAAPLSVVGLSLSIVAFVTSLAPIGFYFGGVLGLLGLAYGLIGFHRCYQNREGAVLVSGMACLLGFLAVLLSIVGFFELQNGLDSLFG